MPIKPDRPSGRVTKLLHHVKKMKVGALLSCSKHGQRELHLINRGNCYFSQSTALALMELEGFAFKVVYLLWLLILGFLNHLWREGTVRGTLSLMVIFSFSSVGTALANRQYLDHFTQHGFNSSSAVPLGAHRAY